MKSNRSFYKRPAFYIIVALVAIVVVAGLYFFKKYKAATTSLKFAISGFKLSDYKLKDIPKILVSGIDGTLLALVQNFSNQTFNVTQVDVSIYTADNVLVASPKSPMSSAIEIKPNFNNTIPFEYSISSAGLQALFKGSNVMALLSQYLSNRTFGKKVYLKGFIISDGIKIDINEVVDI